MEKSDKTVIHYSDIEDDGTWHYPNSEETFAFSGAFSECRGRIPRLTRKSLFM
jgi:hypothetical protein